VGTPGATGTRGDELAAGAGVEESESAEESGEEEGDVPWWEKSKQLLEESSKKNQGYKGIEMGSMIIGVGCIRACVSRRACVTRVETCVL